MATFRLLPCTAVMLLQNFPNQLCGLVMCMSTKVNVQCIIIMQVMMFEVLALAAVTQCWELHDR